MTPNSSTDSATRDGLEACPFCGSSSVEVDNESESSRGRCLSCGAQGSRAYVNFDIDGDPTNEDLVEDHAAEAWNRRTDTLLAASRVEVERLRAKVEGLQKVATEMLELADNWPGVAYTVDLEARTRAELSTTPKG